MRFKIVSVGWECPEWLDQTLASVAGQRASNVDVFIVDDCSANLDQAAKITQWCYGRPTWRYRINPQHLGAVRNQYEAICDLNPADDDVIVFLDLDGDQLAHAGVLDFLAGAYADDTLVTYGNYWPIPDPGSCPPVLDWPESVVKSNAYREEVARSGPHFNHLRTMKGIVFRNIPKSYFQWPDGGWYEAGTDYAFMMAALELAGGRYKKIDDVLCLYNHANDLADNKRHPEETGRCCADILRRQQPLRPLS